MMEIRSPKITKISWGSIEIDNAQVFKDVKLYPGGCRKWDWQETGTRHYIGIQYSDVQELIENGADEIILTKGVLGRLRVPPKLAQQLEMEGLKIHILKTKAAIKLYNSLIKSKKVGALIHTTC